MKNKASLVPEIPAGWALGLVTVTESGEVETEGFLTHFESDYPDEKWLMVFRTQQEARAHLVNTLPADVLESLQLACVEFTALDLLKFLREYPELEGVLFNPGSDEAHFLAANVLMEVLVRHLGALEGDAA
jgi:hypothetical protein